MAKDLTSSQIDRQNILNNEFAINEMKKESNIDAILFDGKYCFTKEMIASFFEIDIRTVERYLGEHSEELQSNGYEYLRGKKLKRFIEEYSRHFGPDINVATKTTILGIFDFKAFLNMAMLLVESEKAKALRKAMLDIVIDLINKKTGGATKYINQRDKEFIFSSLQEDNYRRIFTDALKECVCEDKYKYSYFTDRIYYSIFKEKAKEYKKILDLKATDKVRDTFYSEILDLIASYEFGLADEIRKEYKKKGTVLTRDEVDEIIKMFEEMALWKPLIHRGRVKMASRDLALRDAFHYQLAEYVNPLSEDEYEKFLGATGEELEKLMEENKDVLRRLKERE